MDRTERLLDLVALLLDAREPISWAELREAFPEDYGQGSDDAAERKFERDKAELLELGIPLSYVQGDDEKKDGYLVDREAYYLPDVELTPEELAVLYAAGSAALASGAFPGRQDLAHAMRKIGFSSPDAVNVPRLRVELSGKDAGSDVAGSLEQLWGAISARKWVELAYYSPKAGTVTQRRVDPYGLGLRQGVWSLVGYCHLRQGLRTFHVHRIRELKVNGSKPKSPDFTVPADFKLDDFLASHPWQYRFHPPVEVTLSLSGDLAKLAGRAFPGAQVAIDASDGQRAQVTVSATFVEGLVRYALSLGPECVVVAPPEARLSFEQSARRVLEAHQPGSNQGQPARKVEGTGS